MVALLLGGLIGAQSVSKDANEWQSQLVTFATKKLGDPVGNGECADLAAKGLESIQAQPFGTWGDYPSTGDYVWGKRTSTLTREAKPQELKPGDILQFRNIRISTKSGYVTSTYTASQHTAIVESFDSVTGLTTILHQNSNGRRYVVRDTLDLAGIKSGTIWAYSPVPIASRR